MNIKFLLKFGQRIHLEDFVNGFLYCSNAEQLWKIEDEQSIKGQGDTLEASAIMYAQNMTLQSKTTNITVQLGQSKGKVRFEPAKKIPVFCMFAVYEEDCIYQNRNWSESFAKPEQSAMQASEPEYTFTLEQTDTHRKPCETSPTLWRAMNN